MEAEFLDWLRGRLGDGAIGDDAALLPGTGDHQQVVSTDLIAEGTHFELGGDVTLQRVGRKALAVNLSDLAAMAAKPAAAFVALLLPRDGALETAQALYEGMFPLAEQFNLRIAGGDTNCWDGPLAISVTVIGQVTQHGPLTRGGAQPGDVLVVTGPLGGSRLGKHLDFTPRVEEALWLNANYNLHAGLDISDGLLLDASRLAAESRCGAVIRRDAVPVTEAAADWATNTTSSKSALDHALTDGEDFELLLALPPAEAARLSSDPSSPITASVVGTCTEEVGLWLERTTGERTVVDPIGYQH